MYTSTPYLCCSALRGIALPPCGGQEIQQRPRNFAAGAAGAEISLVTNGVTWRVVIDSSSRTATLGKDGWDNLNNLAPYRACDVNTSVTTDKIPWTFTYDGVAYTVTKVVDFAFFQVRGLTGILTIPDAVTVIGTDAFGEAIGLTGLKGFGGVTDLGHYAFQGCPNMVGEYPDFSRLTSIGEFPFINCPHMTGKLKLGESLPTISRLACFPRPRPFQSTRRG